MKRFGFLTVAMASMLVLATSLPALSSEVSLWGSTTCQKRFLEPGADALAKATGIDMKIYGVGTGKGMLALFDGKSEVTISSNTLEESIKSAQKVCRKEGRPATAVPVNLQFHQITEDVIVPIVNASNPVQNLTWEQLSDLNTGKIRNWLEVGGPDLPVQVVTSHAGSSTKAVFKKMVMKKADYASDAIEVRSTRLEIKQVSKHPGGIGAVSAGFFNLGPEKSKRINTPPIVRPLGLITVGPPSTEVQALIDFFRSPEGKKHIVN